MQVKCGNLKCSIKTGLLLEQTEQGITLNGKPFVACDRNTLVRVDILDYAERVHSGNVMYVNGNVRTDVAGNVLTVEGTISHVKSGTRLSEDSTITVFTGDDVKYADAVKLHQPGFAIKKEFIIMISDWKTADITCNLVQGFVNVCAGANHVKADNCVSIKGNVGMGKAGNLAYHSKCRNKRDIKAEYKKMLERDRAFEAEFAATFNDFMKGSGEEQVFVITALSQNGVKYLKSMFKDGRYALTGNIQNARKFKTENEVKQVIKSLTPAGMQKGILFSYDKWQS